MEKAAGTVTVERGTYESMTAEIAELRLLVEHYKQQLLCMKRRQFGVSSEKMAAGQITVFEPEGTAPPPEAETEEIRYTRKKRKGKREADLSGLEVQRVDYELPESERGCPHCGETMRDIGVTTRRELTLIPAKVVVTEHAAHSYACRRCEREGDSVPVVRAQGPVPLLSGSLASPSLVAHIAVQKYTNGMPLYRLEHGFRYDGVFISRQTMSNWVILCSERYLEPVYELLKMHLLAEGILHGDETVVQVLRELARAAQTKSYEWVYRTGAWARRRITIYEYQQTRSQEHPRAFLKDFKGILHTDGYQAYHNLPPEITVVGCWAHARRKFEAIVKNTPQEQRKDSNAGRGMTYINALFSLERKFADLPPEERKKQRLEQSKPVADAFFAWASGLFVLPKAPIGEAVHYALSQRRYLENVFVDGRTEITNNRAERGVKPFVMGRKAWLFSCTPAGARASSVMYSILETAKDNSLHPYRYMEFPLSVLPATTTSGLEALLPWSDSLPNECRVIQKQEGCAYDKSRA
jgi:transposase